MIHYGESKPLRLRMQTRRVRTCNGEAEDCCEGTSCVYSNFNSKWATSRAAEREQSNCECRKLLARVFRLLNFGSRRRSSSRGFLEQGSFLPGIVGRMRTENSHTSLLRHDDKLNRKSAIQACALIDHQIAAKQGIACCLRGPGRLPGLQACSMRAHAHVCMCTRALRPVPRAISSSCACVRTCTSWLLPAMGFQSARTWQCFKQPTDTKRVALRNRMLRKPQSGRVSPPARRGLVLDSAAERSQRNRQHQLQQPLRN